MTMIKEMMDSVIKTGDMVKANDPEMEDRYTLGYLSSLDFVLDKFKELAKNDRTNEIIFDMLDQCCGNEDSTEIDNRCMSCYEHACEYLAKEGWLEEINSRMYKVIEHTPENLFIDKKSEKKASPKIKTKPFICNNCKKNSMYYTSNRKRYFCMLCDWDVTGQLKENMNGGG